MRPFSIASVLPLASVVLAVASTGCGRSTAHPTAAESPTVPVSVATDSPPPPSALAPSPSAEVTAPSSSIELDVKECRSSGPAYRLTVAADGAVAFTGLRNVSVMSGRSTVDPAAVRALVDRMMAGIDRWGGVACKEEQGVRCSMHPCWVVLRITKDGVTHTASRTSDARPASPAFAGAVADVDRLAGVSRWIGVAR